MRSKSLVEPTSDLVRAREDLDRSGYCIVENLIPVDLNKQLKIRINEQAEAERGAGIAHIQDGNTQWIANALNKGRVFMDLLTCAEESHQLVEHLIGANFILSCSNVPIAGPNTQRMGMHCDQYWTPGISPIPTEHYRLGDMSFATIEGSTDSGATNYLFPPCMSTLMWAVTDFTAINGATVFVPGSHLSGRQPQYDGEFANAVPAEAPAGSVIIWDGRTWHATGANQTESDYRIGVTNNFVAPMIRTLVNYPYSLREEVIAGLDEQEKQLLGFTTWSGYGNEGVPSQQMPYFKAAEEQLGPIAIDKDLWNL